MIYLYKYYIIFKTRLDTLCMYTKSIHITKIPTTQPLILCPNSREPSTGDEIHQEISLRIITLLSIVCECYENILRVTTIWINEV